MSIHSCISEPIQKPKSERRLLNMINEHYAVKYCCGDISLIENYAQAVSDKTQTWDCHHNAEILPCGRFSVKDLMKHGLYWNQPPNRLIFLPHTYHMSLHLSGPRKWQKARGFFKGKHHSSETKQKLRDINLGKHSSIETRMKQSKSLCGLKWWNNGVENKRSRECPGEGWTGGRLWYSRHTAM